MITVAMIYDLNVVAYYTSGYTRLQQTVAILIAYIQLYRISCHIPYHIRVYLATRHAC